MRFQCTFCFTIIRHTSGGDRVSCPNCGKQVAVPRSPFDPGCVIDDFVIQHEIGKGGMATVYAAKQLSLDRVVALKILSEEYSKKEKFRQAFLKEAKAAARLNHPNIVQAIRVDEEDGILFYAMEYVRGQTLAAKIEKEKTLDIDVALNVIQQCAEALHLAWTQERLIHRDIKPDNIILAEDGYAKIMDLGIAVTVDESATAEISGTPAYMAPEQFRKERLDCRTDIYALGCTLYHALVGFPPFDGENVKEIARKHIFTPLQFPSNDLIYLPQRVKRLISKMMAKEPNDRIQDYDELLGEIVALRKRLSPHSDQIPNVHTISFSKYRLQEKKDDSPSQIYRRRASMKQKVALAKEQSEKRQKWSFLQSWVVLGGVGALLLVILLIIFFIFLFPRKSSFARDVQIFLDRHNNPSSFLTSLEDQDWNVKAKKIEEELKVIDSLMTHYPERPNRLDRQLWTLLNQRNLELGSKLLEIKQKRLEVMQEELDKERQAFQNKIEQFKSTIESMEKLRQKEKELHSQLREKDQQYQQLLKSYQEQEGKLKQLTQMVTQLEANYKQLLEQSFEKQIMEITPYLLKMVQEFRFAACLQVIRMFAGDTPELQTWRQEWVQRLNSGQKIYTVVYDSGTQLRGINISRGKVQEVKTNTLFLLVTDGSLVSRQEVLLHELPFTDVILLAKEVWDGNLIEYEKACWDLAVCSGNFSWAKNKLADFANDKDFYNRMLYRFLAGEMLKIRYELLYGNRNNATQRYRSLKSEYGDTQEFPKAEGLIGNFLNPK